MYEFYVKLMLILLLKKITSIMNVKIIPLIMDVVLFSYAF